MSELQECPTYYLNNQYGFFMTLMSHIKRTNPSNRRYVTEIHQKKVHDKRKIINDLMKFSLGHIDNALQTCMLSLSK